MFSFEIKIYILYSNLQSPTRSQSCLPLWSHSTFPFFTSLCPTSSLFPPKALALSFLTPWNSLLAYWLFSCLSDSQRIGFFSTYNLELLCRNTLICYTSFVILCIAFIDIDVFLIDWLMSFLIPTPNSIKIKLHNSKSLLLFPERSPHLNVAQKRHSINICWNKWIYACIYESLKQDKNHNTPKFSWSNKVSLLSYLLFSSKLKKQSS